MQNLLSIEANFLNLSQVKAGLNLQEIRSVQRTITNAKKKKFEQTLTLSKLVSNAVEWFNSDEGKRICSEEGISWSNEEIGQKVFGWQKSFFYKVVKAGKLPQETVDTFKAKCDEIETQGEEPNRTLEGLLKYAKQVENNTQDGGESSEDGENGEGGENNTPQVETRVETILTFTFKGENGNVSVRVNANGEVKTTNNYQDIINGVQVLLASVRNLNI